ncbi:hypothetical protein D3C83_262490 [compost metagenome]
MEGREVGFLSQDVQHRRVGAGHRRELVVVRHQAAEVPVAEGGQFARKIANLLIAEGDAGVG